VRKIGQDQPIYIIAEVGSNWESLDDCEQAIDQAKACGADAVKFQLFTHESLYGFPGEKDHCLPVRWISNLSARAKSAGIDFLCTAFSEEDYRFLDPFVDAHKVASSNNNHAPILKYLKTVKKPVFVSTGGSTMAQIESISTDMIPGADLILLYCVAEYPTTIIDPRQVAKIRSQCGVRVGISDHSKEVFSVPITAHRIYGAVAIEKHVNFFGPDSIEAGHSLSTGELMSMVSALRGDEVGSKIFHSELDMHQQHKCRIMATKDIEIGERYAYGKNYGFFRSKVPVTAMAPAMALLLQGCRATSIVKQGDPVPKP